MSSSIGNVNVQFTASAAGLVSTIEDIRGKFGAFAAAQRKVSSDSEAYRSRVSDLRSQLVSGSLSTSEYIESVTKLQNRFRNLSEADRARDATLALSEAEAAGVIDANELAQAYGDVSAAVRAATGPLERLSVDLAKNRSDYLAGKISVEQYRQTIAAMPGEINGTETAQARMNRVFVQAQATVKSLRSPTADYEDQLRQLSEQLEAGLIDDQQYAAAKAKVEAAMTATAAKGERLSATLAQNRADFLAGRISVDQYREVIAGIPKATQAAETAEQRMDRILRETQETLRKIRTPADEYKASLAKLREQLDAGTIDEDQFAAATRKAKEELDGTKKSAKSIGDAFGDLPGPLGAAARAFDLMKKSMKGSADGFKGGIGAGVSGVVGQVRNAVSTAGATGGESLVAVAPQIALIAAAGATAIKAVTALSSALMEVGSRVERTSQFADRLGVSFQQYEILSVAANMAGVETDALASAQTRAFKAISAARSGAGEEAEAFAALGISQQMLAETNPSLVIEMVASKIREIEDPATRASLAMKLLGKSGNDVLPALAGIEAVRAGIQRLGGVMNDADKARFSGLDDAFDGASRAVTRLGEVMLTPFTEAFTNITEGFAAAVGGMAAQFAPTADLLASLGGVMTVNIRTFGEALGLAGRAAGAVFTIIRNGVVSVAQWAAQSSLLAPAFKAVTGTIEFIRNGIAGIGGWVEYIVKKLEEWAGITIAPMKAGSDAEAVEASAAAAKAAAEEEKEAMKAVADEIDRGKKQISEAIDAAAKYGTAGFDAAHRFQEAVAVANAELERGVLNETSHANAVREAKGAFDEQMKAIEDRNKAAQDIGDQFNRAMESGKAVGAAADEARNQLVEWYEDIRSQLGEGLIDPDEARNGMKAAVDQMNEELRKLGEDQKFAEKIIEGLKTPGEKLREELGAIDANKTLTDDQKAAAKQQAQEKAAAGLPGAAAEAAGGIEKYRQQLDTLKKALDDGVINAQQFEERKANLKNEARREIPGEAPEDPLAKFRRDREAVQAAMNEGIIGQKEAKDREDRLREELASTVADARDQKAAATGPDRRENRAAEVNTSEGVSTFFRLLRGEDGPTAQQISEVRKQTKLLERVEQALAEPVVVKI